MKGLSLRIVINNLEFESPFILASAPPTASYESIKKAFDAGWGGVVVKTVRPESVLCSNVTPRFAFLKQNNKIIGMQNIEVVSEKPLNYWFNTISTLKKDYPSKIIIASIMGSDKKTWEETAIRMCNAGADALELNFSCPHGVTQQGLGLSIGQDLEAIQKITSWVKKVSVIPVLVKLTSNVCDIGKSAMVAVNGGADGISAINTVPCLIGVDIENLSPLPNVNGYSTYGGYSGIGIKPIGLRCIAQIAKAVDVPIYGMGGISNWQDTVEYILLGSNAVQVCTEVMINGYSIVESMISGLKGYMLKKGFSSIDEFRGQALSKITTHSDLSRKYKVYAKINPSKCIKCSKCSNICTESGYDAIMKHEDDHFWVNKDKCDGCSLCTYICTKSAISMEVQQV